MKIGERIANIVGALTLKAYDTDNNLLWEDKGHNLIVEQGYQIAAELLGGLCGAFIAKVGIGSNNNLPVLSDTILSEDAWISNIESVKYPSPGTVQFIFRIGYEDAVGMKIQEFGLITTDNRLFSRKTREPIDKTENMTILGTWEINFMDK